MSESIIVSYLILQGQEVLKDGDPQQNLVAPGHKINDNSESWSHSINFK